MAIRWSSQFGVQDGGLALSHAPGIGYDWNEEAITHYRSLSAK